MKNRHLPLLLISICALTGCGKSIKPVDDHFKEYSFKNRAKNVSAIIQGVEVSFQSLSSFEKTLENYSFSDSGESLRTTKRNGKIQEDSSKPSLLICKTKINENTFEKSNGIQLNEVSEKEELIWDGGKAVYYTHTSNKVNGLSSDTYNAYKTNKDSQTLKNDYLVSLKPNLNGISLSWYVCSDGSYTGIQSSSSESIEAMTWGTTTKERKIIRRDQYVFNVDKNYRLTDYYTYSEYKTNRDPYSGKWFDSVKVIQNSYESAKYTYGKRGPANIDQLNAKVQGKNFVTNAYIKCNTYVATSSDGLNYNVNLSSKVETSYSCTKTKEKDNNVSFECLIRINGKASASYYAQNYTLNLTIQDLNGESKSFNYELNLEGIKGADLYVLKTTDATYLCNTSGLARIVKFEIRYDGARCYVDSITVS